MPVPIKIQEEQQNMQAVQTFTWISVVVLMGFFPFAYGGLPVMNTVQEPAALTQKTLESLTMHLRKAGQHTRLNASDYDALIWQVRQIGLQRERQRWTSLVNTLHPKVLEAVDTTSATRRGRFHLQAAVLMALGRLGNPESIAPLEHLKKHLDPYFRREMLPVVIARIHAESQIPIPASTAEWQEKASLFLSKAGLSLSEAIAALEIYGERSRTWPPDNLLEAPRGVIALRMLAEMAGEAFANGAPGAFQLLEGLGKDLLEKDYILWLRIQLGKRTAAERIPWLINGLLQDGVQTIEDRFLQQALVDCGEQAVPALVAKIEGLDQAEPASSAYRLHLDLLLETLSFSSRRRLPRSWSDYVDILTAISQMRRGHILHGNSGVKSRPL